MDNPQYDYPKEDIEKMLGYLRLNLPDYSTPENAVKLLHYYKGYFDALSLDPETLEDVLKDLEAH